MPRKQPLGDHSAVEHVHETKEAVACVELSPAHPPREETANYRRTHNLMIHEKDMPCHVCGIRNSTLSDVAGNLYHATQLESHHYPIERSLLHACDWRKVHATFPAVYSQESLEMWVDSPENMLILCDVHHRSLKYGIHHLLTQDFAILPYLIDGYVISDDAQHADADVKLDELLEAKAGLMPVEGDVA